MSAPRRGSSEAAGIGTRLAVVAVALALIAAACTDDDPARAPDPGGPYAGATAAPEFPSGLDWLNTGGEAMTLASLRGKIVALNFWSSGCVSCLHALPELDRLAAEFPDSLAVVGVHVPRFSNETPIEAVRQTVMRLGIDHPVVNDPELSLWEQWGADTQPTVALVDPAGNAVGVRGGEGVYDALRPVIAGLAGEFEGAIDATAREFPLEREAALPTVLSYPSSAVVDTQQTRAYIADTANNRIVAVALPSGDVLAVYGTGTATIQDGSGAEASFAQPRGMALSPDARTLYVADSGNHAIRTIDVVTGEVGTIAGTGRLGAWPPQGGDSPDVALRSPWDLALADSILYVAMAGSHQLWSIDLDSGRAEPIAGTGTEGIADGPAANAALTRPSSIAVDPTGQFVYFADPESSTIRYLDLAADEVRTVAGDSSQLFIHGDQDGTGTQARLQVPGGLAFSGQLLHVADTYNHKVKTVTHTGQVVTTFGGDAGWRDGPDPRFYEPAGIDIVDDTLYVADTNNHALRIIDLLTGEATTLVLRGIEAFQPDADDENYRGTIVELEPVEVAAGDGSVVIDITLPPNHKVNEDAPSSVQWIVDGGVAAFSEDLDLSLTGAEFPVSYPVTFDEGAGAVTADLNVFWCASDAVSLCFIEQVRLQIPVVAGTTGSTELRLSHEITLPEIPS
ncbi:MAG: redoxin family protein [Acidimicrobiia bacterium]|nr:redoxin family protein [Acidimicrobiia bacterium]